MDVEEGNRGRGEEASVVALSGRRAVRRVRIRPAPPEGTFVLRQHPSPANPPTPLRSPASARAPPDGIRTDERTPRGRNQEIICNQRKDGRTDRGAHRGASERASNQAPTTHNAEAGSVVVASCRHPRSPHRRARILLPPPPRRRRRRHAESLLLAGRLDANVGGRKVVKGCSSLPCPLRDLAPSFLLSFPPSVHLLPRGCLARQCHGA